MKNGLYRAERVTRVAQCVSKSAAAACKVRESLIKQSCLIVFCAALITACHKKDPQDISKLKIEVVKTTSCDSSVLLSSSPHYAGFEPIPVDGDALVSKFSPHIDMKGQEVTKFQRKDGLRVYDAAPRIFTEIYKGPWKTSRREMSIMGKKNGYFANAGHAPKYHFELGAFVKDPATNMYSIDPSKLTFFLSHKFTMPEWQAVGEVTDRQRALWDKLYCKTALHERTHTEITREHILGTIDEMLNLKAPTRDEIKNSVYKTWHYRRTELMVMQNLFDEEEKRKSRGGCELSDGKNTCKFK